MKGKIAFVLGAAVGYVLGSRAGRERYEQIKRGAESLWHTEPVQRGVGAVRGALDERADDVKAFIRRASSDAFANFARQTAPQQPPRNQKSDGAEVADEEKKKAAPGSGASKTAESATAKSEKPSAAKPARTKSAKAKPAKGAKADS